MVDFDNYPEGKIDDSNYEIEDENTSTPANLYSISSYGIDFPVETLVRRIQKNQIFVPDFQREFVWSKNSASRFIESLLLGLPVPSIFLCKEPNSEKHLIIDGQQRLMSLVCFYKETFNGRKFSLSGISSDWKGKSYNSLNEDDQLRLDNSWIRTTIFQQDSPKNNMDSVYELFERLNTGGVKLSPQEIRSCIYHGKFNNFIHGLNSDPTWRKLCGPKSKRLRDIEMILRFFAFFEEEEHYAPPMKHFLNLYMEKNRGCPDEKLAELENIFINTMGFIESTLGPDAFRPEKAFNAAVFDSVATSIAKGLKGKEPLTKDATIKAYKSLLKDDTFKQGYITSTASLENVKRRFGAAKKAFGVK